MTVHYAFTRPRPAMPRLFPDTLDDLCFARFFANRMGCRIVDHSSKVPLHLARVLGDFERRIEARIAQVAK